MTSQKAIGYRIKTTDKYTCKKCGKTVHLSGYLQYTMQGILRPDVYKYCDECKNKIIEK